MAQDANVELEVKLTLDPQDLGRAKAALETLTGCETAPPVVLRNIYYDTPGFTLNRERMALRVRQKGSRFIQTLKTRGDFVDGGHRRMEWEWLLESAELDLALLAETPLGDQVSLDQLKPVFETNFERQVLMATESGSDRDTLVEVAIDQGRILSGDQLSALSEIEFELKSGNPSALRDMAVKLAESVPVFLNVISKAEQGYHLAGVESPFPESTGDLNVYGFFHCLSACWLRRVAFPSVADISRLRRAAVTAGVSEDFERLFTQLHSGRPVNELVADGLMGRVQLALAGVQGF
ncbi:CYTH domain-containing protein [Marinobacter confluentis]|uniref:CYTH domain-containing protein n=1 Tax=Marinobacter confluentis TaxID=1697557 RepID=A0A4Z1BYN4_9GAMM|nr:CYTH domain-containing protein [Marinobacter confluentis]TGN38530.1 CYTH domain-containing protein [Marinobacter confluentis]